MRTLKDLKTYASNVCKSIGMEYDYLDFQEEKELMFLFTILKDSKHDLYSEGLK
jgi:hypothetical protein